MYNTLRLNRSVGLQESIFLPSISKELVRNLSIEYLIDIFPTRNPEDCQVSVWLSTTSVELST